MTKVLVVVSVAASGCGYRERARTIHAGEIGSPAAVITNYMSAPIRGGSPTEDTPGGVSREAVVDEARLEVVTPGQTCVSFVVRTDVDLDMPLSDWNLKLGGQTVHASDELVTVRDHSYRGERDVLVANAVTADAFASLHVTQPSDEVYRVFERAGRACAPVTGKKVVLELERPMDDHRGSWGEKFVWQLD